MPSKYVAVVSEKDLLSVIRYKYMQDMGVVTYTGADKDEEYTRIKRSGDQPANRYEDRWKSRRPEC